MIKETLLASIADPGKVRLGGFAPTIGPGPKAPTRRLALKVSVAGALAAAVAACAGKTSAQITQQAVMYAADVANGLATFAQESVGLPNAAVIQGYAADAVAAANALSTSLTATAAQPVVMQISSDVSAVANAVKGMSLSSQALTILQDVELALQILLPLIGLLAPTPVTAAAVTDAATALATLHSLPTVMVDGIKTINR